MASNSKKLQICGCDLPMKLRKQDLRILEINSKNYRLSSLEIVDWEQKLCLRDLIEAINPDKTLQINIEETENYEPKPNLNKGVSYF